MTWFEATDWRTGKTTTILGRSERLAVSWTVRVHSPPPPPAATPRHYEGKTVQNEAFRFDGAPGGLELTNLQTGQINERCEPKLYLGRGSEHGGPLPVAADGIFTIKGSFASTVDGAPSTKTITIAGRISGGAASGTYREETSFTSNGSGYACSSGDQTWSAARTG